MPILLFLMYWLISLLNPPCVCVEVCRISSKTSLFQSARTRIDYRGLKYRDIKTERWCGASLKSYRYNWMTLMHYSPSSWIITLFLNHLRTKQGFLLKISGDIRRYMTLSCSDNAGLTSSLFWTCGEAFPRDSLTLKFGPHFLQCFFFPEVQWSDICRIVDIVHILF